MAACPRRLPKEPSLFSRLHLATSRWCWCTEQSPGTPRLAAQASRLLQTPWRRGRDKGSSRARRPLGPQGPLPCRAVDHCGGVPETIGRGGNGEGLGTVRCPVTLPPPIRAAGGPSSNSQRYSRTRSFPTGDSALESPNSTLGFTLLDRGSVDSGLQEIRSVGCGENLCAAADSLHRLSAFLSVKWARSSLSRLPS